MCRMQEGMDALDVTHILSSEKQSKRNGKQFRC